MYTIPLSFQSEFKCYWSLFTDTKFRVWSFETIDRHVKPRYLLERPLLALLPLNAWWASFPSLSFLRCRNSLKSSDISELSGVVSGWFHQFVWRSPPSLLNQSFAARRSLILVEGICRLRNSSNKQPGPYGFYRHPLPYFVQRPCRAESVNSPPCTSHRCCPTEVWVLGPRMRSPFCCKWRTHRDRILCDLRLHAVALKRIFND